MLKTQMQLVCGAFFFIAAIFIVSQSGIIWLYPFVIPILIIPAIFCTFSLLYTLFVVEEVETRLEFRNNFIGNYYRNLQLDLITPHMSSLTLPHFCGLLSAVLFFSCTCLTVLYSLFN